MKIFVDANILVSVVNKEYPVYAYSARVLSLADYPSFDVYTSPLCLAIAFYFAEKKSGTKHARQKLVQLAKKLNCTRIDETTLKQTIANSKVLDLEDGLQYYSAIESGCEIIVTEDSNDFYFSDIEVLPSRKFLEKYVF